jgi:glutamate formiminotransferase
MHPDALIEAVPNFSEGRCLAVVDALVAALLVPGVALLDRTSDWDHHRSVLTVAGPPAAVVEGLLRAIRVAAQSIDLFNHHGAHPRLGAADVVPLVPLHNITLAECITLAHALGHRVGTELGLPVYFYAAAALRPDRRLLPDVRRGEFESLLTTITTPARLPDAGPAQVGPAGAVIIGARPVLIAYNVFLATDNLAIAHKIARRIRERDGGLPGVRALGLFVNGQAQVSVNLVDYTQTPLHLLFAEIERHAHELGVTVDRSELIGLAPQAAIFAAAAHYLKLPALAPTQTLEGALAHAQQANHT